VAVVWTTDPLAVSHGPAGTRPAVAEGRSPRRRPECVCSRALYFQWIASSSESETARGRMGETARYPGFAKPGAGCIPSGNMPGNPSAAVDYGPAFGEAGERGTSARRIFGVRSLESALFSETWPNGQTLMPVASCFSSAERSWRISRLTIQDIIPFSVCELSLRNTAPPARGRWWRLLGRPIRWPSIMAPPARGRRWPATIARHHLPWAIVFWFWLGLGSTRPNGLLSTR